MKRGHFLSIVLKRLIFGAIKVLVIWDHYFLLSSFRNIRCFSFVNEMYLDSESIH
jgi:hypothetical protein